MLNRFKKAFYLLVTVVGLSCQQKHAQLIPIKTFFDSQTRGFHISPDGQYISYIKSIKDKQAQVIVLRNVATGKEQVAATFSEFFVRDHFWTYNNRIIVPQSDREQKTFHLLAIDIGTLKMDTLLSATKVNFRLLNRSVRNPDILTFTLNQRDSSIFDVYHINTKTREMKMYLKNPGNITQYYPDVDGSIRLEKASDGVNETILFRRNDNSEFKPVVSNNFKNMVEPVAFTGIKDYFYARSNVNRDKVALVEINAENGKEEKVIFGSDKADIGEVSYSKTKKRLEMVAWQEDKPRRYILNDSIKAIYVDLEKQLPGNEIRISDRDTAEAHFLVNTSSDRNPGSTYLYDVKAKKLLKLADMNPGISPADLCEMKPVHFKASDGMLINGYLTLPKGSSGENLPVVVIPHNDFWNRNNWGYSADVQFLANRGYAVFQVNYRGSNGYGKAFYSAGFRQLGGKMQQDITEGVQWLIDQKIANPKRIAIFGSRFGGFSALYGVSFHPDLYACAVVQAPLINLFTFIKDVQPYLKPQLSMLYEKIGNPETDVDMFRSISPVFNANKIKVPVMINQGPGDPTNANELNHFASELKKNGVPVIYKVKESRIHKQGGRGAVQGRLSMYTDLEKFLEAHLGKK
jgi:protease II